MHKIIMVIAAQWLLALAPDFPRKKVGCHIPLNGACYLLSCPAGRVRPGGELRTGN